MRGLGKLAAAPCCPTTTVTASAFAAKQSFLSSTSSHAYSTFSDGGGGRGRGRGSGPPPQTPPPPRVPGKTGAEDDEDAFVSPGLGHGRGHTVLPSSAVLPSFSSWMSSAPPSAAGRGRGRPPPPPNSAESPDSHPKMPIFFRREDSVPPPVKSPSSDPEPSAPLPSRFAPALPVAGRGKPTKPAESDARATQENRHRRPRAPVGSPEHRPLPSQPKLGQEEAVRKAMEVLNRPGGGRDVRERGGRGRSRGRGIERGRSRGRRSDDAFEDSGLYLGDNADGERLQKRLGEENMKLLNEAFDEMSGRVLPSPSEEAYLDALHTNNMIEYEPEYLVEFDRNPDIDEKPPMSLEDALQKAKPFLMAYEGIQSQEEWEEIVKETMERVPYMKELMDMYCGPDTVTAKQQQQELERVAKTLPEDIPSSVKRFTDRAVLSLQSNPGWGWDKKCQFMDKLVWEVSQQYK